MLVHGFFFLLFFVSFGLCDVVRDRDKQDTNEFKLTANRRSCPLPFASFFSIVVHFSCASATNIMLCPIRFCPFANGVMTNTHIYGLCNRLLLNYYFDFI